MIPTALLFSRYRAFRDPVRLELAPLTIVIGKNGGGKSVITRLSLIISSGLSSLADAPIDLAAGGITHASRFEDIIYQRSAQPFTLGAEISDRTNSYTFLTTLRHLVEKHSVGIESFELSSNGENVIRFRAAQPEDIGSSPGTFLTLFGRDSEEQEARIGLTGLFPSAVENRSGISDLLVEIRGRFEAAFAQPSYLGPFRSEQGALPRIPRQGIRDLGPRGERALDILGDDGLRRDGGLVRAVEEWFENAMGGNRIKLERAGNLPRMLVHDPLRNIDVDIAETGAGFAQAFPIVVQSFARRIGRIASPIVIVEQPELHLHPGAHGDLADLIADTARECSANVRYICETHSEQIITRLRRRVAEGRLPNNMVKIISVGHQATSESVPEPLRAIEIDSQGNASAWPIGVFDEAFNDLIQMKAVNQRGVSGE